ncbi:MAG: FAD-dependent oxidoreductase [Chloroflexi bacterium]|nr:FAD-dependent oxidoreductase [Chloroflexota bacterium]
MTNLQHLFQPIKIGNLNLANRIVLLSMALGYADSGKPAPRLIKFLRERAVGGCGVVCTPFSVFPVGDTFLGYMGLDASSDEHILPIKQVADSIHDCGVPVIGQLNTLTVWRRDSAAQLEIVGPSAFTARPKGHLPREMTRDEIKIFIKQYGLAARRLREAGYDAVEIMGGVGNIVSRFISPLANQRRDEYGGSFENRMRLPLEIIRDIKREAGEDFTILWRYSGHEFLEGGYDIAGAIDIGKALEKAGAKWLSIQVGWHDSPIPLITREVAQGSFAYISEAIKKAVGIPVVTSYRITDPVMANRLIAEGKADLVGLARALISDPEWAKKAAEGKLDEINRCICCCRCVDQTVAAGKGLEVCSVNARIGEDIDTGIKPAAKRKKVYIVGSGPAGLEAARVCALRGHEVTIFEKGAGLGGMLNVAKLPPDKFEIGYLQDYLENQVKKMHIKTILNKEISEGDILNGQPDCVIIATGSLPAIPDIPGVRSNHVITALEVLSGNKVDWRKVVVIGGGLIGCEVSAYITSLGGEVTILEMLPKIGMDIGAAERFITVNKLKRLGVRMETGVAVVEITDSGVRANRANEQLVFKADRVVLATGMQRDDYLYKAIRKRLNEVYSIGDCVEPRRIGEAVKEGYRTGLKV